MDKTAYGNDIEIRYDNGVQCEKFSMNRFDFGAFIAPLDERLGLVLRDSQNFKNGVITLPDEKSYNSFLEELTYQGVEVYKKHNGVSELSFPEVEEESGIENLLTQRVDKMQEEDVDDPNIEAVLEEDPAANKSEVREGLALMQRHSKQFLRYF